VKRLSDWLLLAIEEKADNGIGGSGGNSAPSFDISRGNGASFIISSLVCPVKVQKDR
jgi:hypothetical protein